MKLVLDTYMDVAFGTRRRQIHAMFTFLNLVRHGAFLVSVLSEYFDFLSSHTASIVGGVIMSAIVAY